MDYIVSKCIFGKLVDHRNTARFKFCLRSIPIPVLDFVIWSNFIQVDSGNFITSKDRKNTKLKSDIQFITLVKYLQNDPHLDILE